MEIVINEQMLGYLLGESRRRFTKCEAFAFLYSMIDESDEGFVATSCNRLAKTWKWDNHQVADFLGKLIDMKIIASQHDGSSLVLYFAEKFISCSSELSSLFSLLCQTDKKADRLEAFFHVIRNALPSTDNKAVVTSDRSLATELGWSHHTVHSFIDFMVSNGIISKTPADGGYCLTLTQKEN